MADASDFQLQNSAQSIEYGRESVRLGVAINGGAAVAIIGFVGGEQLTNTNVEQIRDALLWFCLGVVFSFLAAMVGYIAQMQFALHNSRRIEGKHTTTRFAVGASALGLVFVILSVATFVWGVYVSGQALFPDPTVPTGG